MVAKLVEAAVEELRLAGYEGLTVRNVARRAGVASATAYTWFASKDHLVAEAFWRRLLTVPEVRIDRRWAPARRIGEALRPVGEFVASAPELAAAATTAVLAADPDVAALRLRIGAFMHRRMLDALGDDSTEPVIAALDLVFSGALLQAGMGVFPYEELADRMTDVAALLTGGVR